jgi:hypothetical protein
MMSESTVTMADLVSEVAEPVERLLLASVRDDAVMTLRELHRRTHDRERGLSAEAFDVRDRPEYWLGELEGTVLGLVASIDVVLDESATSATEPVVNYLVEARKGGRDWITMSNAGDDEVAGRMMHQDWLASKRHGNWSTEYRLVKRVATFTDVVLQSSSGTASQ